MIAGSDGSPLLLVNARSSPIPSSNCLPALGFHLAGNAVAFLKLGICTQVAMVKGLSVSISDTFGNCTFGFFFKAQRLHTAYWPVANRDAIRHRDGFERTFASVPALSLRLSLRSSDEAKGALNLPASQEIVASSRKSAFAPV